MSRRPTFHGKPQPPIQAFDRRSLSAVIERNIDTIAQLRRESEDARSVQEHLADLISRFSGSMPFIILHAVWFPLWMVWNLGWLGLKPFDPFPFGLLTMVVSLEAIFLSTFVLLSQNREAQVADRRAELDLQINLLSEYEITRVLKLLDAVCDKLEIETEAHDEVRDLEKDIQPSELMQKIVENGEPK
jgi:uncharacterized membrane protein